MWVCEDCNYEHCEFPADDFTRTDAEMECGGDVELHEGWWGRLSAPGYMDATGWSGPSDSLEKAKQEIEMLWEVDPDTGEDYEEKMEREVAEFEFD